MGTLKALKSSVFILLVLCAIQVVRLAVYQKYDIDEFTYAHASWLISQGQEPFRDFFLHHFPLSMQLGSIILSVFGDSPGNISFLRLLILPFFILTCLSVGLLNRRNGWLSVCLAPLFLFAMPPFLKYAIQFRPDSIASALFISSLALLRIDRFPPKIRAALAGFILTAAIWASEKVLIYGAGFAVAFILDCALRHRSDRKPLLVNPGMFLAGVTIGLIAISSYLTAVHGWIAWWNYGIKWALAHERYYPGHSWLRFMDLVIAQAGWVMILGTAGFFRHIYGQRNAKGRWFDNPDLLLIFALFLSALSYMIQKAAYLYSLIPFFIIISIFAARETSHWLAQIREFHFMPRIAAAMTVLILGTVLSLQLIRINFTIATPAEINRNQTGTLEKLDQLVGPGHPVYDNSGSYVSRPHVHFFFFTDQMVRKTMPAFLAKEMPIAIRASGCIAFLRDLRYKYLPDSLKDFIRDNFQPFSAEISLWGRSYQPGYDSILQSSFEAVRAADYFIYPPSAASKVQIDGRSVAKIFPLNIGIHAVKYEGDTLFYILWLPEDGKPYAPMAALKTEAGQQRDLFSSEF